MNKLYPILSSLLLLSACNSGQIQRPLDQSPLYGATIGGEFTLTDQNGKTRSFSEFKGKWPMVYFGYTSCPDICTPDMNNLIGGLNMFAAQEPELANKVQPIFITVDPKRDTSENLKQFATAFSDRLLALTGSEEAIADAASKFAVLYNIVEEGRTEDAYLVAHSQVPYLFDDEGKPVTLMPTDQPGTEENEGRPELVANKLAEWVR